jgi:membrane protease YdiL (CAAX protease family)
LTVSSQSLESDPPNLQDPTLVATLKQRPLPELLLHLAQQRQSGWLRIRAAHGTLTLGLEDGTPGYAYSDLPGHGAPGDGALDEVVRLRMREALCIADAKVAFFPAPLELPAETLPRRFLPWLRESLWTSFPLDQKALTALCAQLLQQRDSLEPGTAPESETDLSDEERLTLAQVDGQATAQELVDAVPDEEDRRTERLRAIYFLYLLRFIRARVPLYAQPVLMAPAEVDMAELRRLTTAQASLALARLRRRLQTDPGEGVRLFAEGRTLLLAKEPKAALKKFEMLLQCGQGSAENLAYLAACYETLPTPNLERAEASARRALEVDERSALAHIAMARVYRLQNNARRADVHLSRADELNQARHGQRTEAAALYDLKGPTVTVDASDPRPRARAMLALAASTMVVVFFSANIFKLGANEYYYDGTDWFFYVRRIALLCVGLLGIKIYAGLRWQEVPVRLGWTAPKRWLVLAVAWGATLAYLSPPQAVRGIWATVIGLSLFHALCEEIFFRGFVGRMLLDLFRDKSFANLLCGLVFGLYHVTYFSFFHQTLPLGQFYWCAAIGVFAGIPYANLYQKSGGLLAPFVCHAVCNAGMMAMSVY